MPEYTDKQRILTAPQFAKAIGVAERTLKRWADGGKLPPAFRQPNGRRVYRASQIDDYFNGVYDPSRHELEASDDENRK